MPLDAGFLSLLTAQVSVESFLGEDQWGNASFGPSHVERAFIDPVSQSFGRTDGGEQETRLVSQTTLTMDAVGIAPGDRITLPGNSVTFASEVRTDKDEIGADLYQTVTVTNTERG